VPLQKVKDYFLCHAFMLVFARESFYKKPNEMKGE
jgi:hypothetical protein